MCLLQRYGCICSTCLLFTPAELQINVPEPVDRRTCRSNFDSQYLGDEKAKASAGFHSDLCSCHHKLCENTDPKQILEDGSSDRENYIDGKEEENDE